MNDTMQENTDWISGWIINDERYYHAARDFSLMDDFEGLKNFIIAALETAPKESTAWHVKREMSASDLENVDWEEVAGDLK